MLAAKFFKAIFISKFKRITLPKKNNLLSELEERATQEGE
jgi:hypothetical protein